MKKIKDKIYFFLVPVLKQLKILKPKRWEIHPFRNLIMNLGFSGKTLEIGPFYKPLIKGPHVKFFDVLNQKELIEKAEFYNQQLSHKIPFIDKEKIPFIDFISEVGDLKIINECFDNVVSSHCIEHQPDLVQHFLDVSKLLNQDGKYYLVIPDKRYCFDHFNCESKLEDVLTAHKEKRIKHSLKNVITHTLSMQTHNDSFRHWKGNHGECSKDLSIVKKAMIDFESFNYIDVHAWYFTPKGFGEKLTGLNILGIVDLQVEKIIPTQKNSFEFYVILKK